MLFDVINILHLLFAVVVAGTNRQLFILCSLHRI